jgi:hypothetical protein
MQQAPKPSSAHKSSLQTSEAFSLPQPPAEAGVCNRTWERKRPNTAEAYAHDQFVAVNLVNSSNSCPMPK